MANVLQKVETYQKAVSGFLLNSYFYIDKANKKFKDFEKYTGNLGSTVTFQLSTRYSSTPGLTVTSFQDTEERIQSLTTDKSQTVAYEFSDLERIYDLSDDQYLDEFGEAAVNEIGAEMEADVALNNISHTYRAFGDGITDITTHQQLAQSVANFKNYGSQRNRICAVIPDVSAPAIISSGLTEFATNRNNKEALSWELSAFAGVDWYTSNLLPVHSAGVVGDNQDTLTVVSINAAGTQLTMSGAPASEANAIKEGDILTFLDTPAAVRFRTFIGHKPSAQKVQVRATAPAGSDGGGQVIVNIFPALISTAGDRNQNVTIPIVAGLTLLVHPTHTAGLLFHQPSLLLAMPRLPMKSPYHTSNKMDKESGAAMRLYYGSDFKEETTGFVHSALWGSTLIDEDAMRLVFKTVV